MIFFSKSKKNKKVKEPKKIIKKIIKKVVPKPKPKPVVVTEVTIPNTFGVTKYLDAEEYKAVSKRIQESVNNKATEMGWKKEEENNYPYIVEAEVIRIKKR